MNIETKDKGELEVVSNEDEEVTEQIWILMAAQELVEDSEICQSGTKLVLEIKYWGGCANCGR